MSEIPWVERYRPKTLDEVVGQEHAIPQLKAYVQAYREGRADMPHLMFSGPPGVGKTTVAHALCADLFGEGWRGYTLDTNASADRGINVIRGRIKDFAKTTSLGEKFNVIVLDEADSLTADAQGALRRVMEDYHRSARFVICCNYPQRIIEPIHDRCAQYHFQPIKDEVMATTLTKICDAENVGYTLDGLNAIVKYAQGSLRKGVTKLQAVAAIGDVVESNIPKDETHPFKDIFVQIAQDNVRAAEEALIKIIRKGASTDTVFTGMFEAIDTSSLPEKAKNKILFRLGEYEFRVLEGCNLELQSRCFLRELMAIKG